MPITVQQLKVFRAVALQGRVSLAAASLGISQPSVSQQLRRLEEALGFQLLEKREGRLVPTARGQQVYQIGELIESGLSRLDDLRDEAQLGEEFHLTVGANTTGGMYIAPEMIRAFRRERPHTNVRLLIGHVNELVASVAGGICDIALAGGPISAVDIESETLFEDVLPLVASPVDSFASKASITINDLRARQFILPTFGSRTRLVTETALREVGLEIVDPIEYPDTESVKKAVESGLGIAYLSREGVRRELRHGYLKEIFVEDLRIARPFQAFWPRKRYTPTPVVEFLRCAREQLALRERGTAWMRGRGHQ